MSISVNVHGATLMVAQMSGGFGWVDIHTPSSKASVFMPEDVAKATAEAFNSAMSAHKETRAAKQKGGAA